MVLEQAVSLLIGYRYFILVPIAILEGPIITIITGFLTSLGYFNFFIAYVVIVASDLIGDIAYYLLGYYGGKKFIRRYSTFLRITPERIEQLEKHFEKHTPRTLFIGKLLHGFGAVVLLAAGVAKVPFKHYVWYSLMPTLPKSLILLLIGFYFGKAYVRIDGYLSYISLGTLIVLVLVGTYFGIKKLSTRYEGTQLD